MDAVKFCPDCDALVDMELFRPNGASADGLSTYCADHSDARSAAWRAANPGAFRNRKRKHELRTAYGISPNDYDDLLDLQGYRCGVCRTAAPGHKGMFMVDHDHESGVVRGLLCNRCNSGLGMFLDKPELLLEAAEYLQAGGYGNRISNTHLRS